MADEALIVRALQILSGKFGGHSAIEDVVEHLEGYSDFDDLDDAELAEVARAARARLGGKQPSPVRPGPGRRQGGGPPVEGQARRVADVQDKLKAPFRFAALDDRIARPVGRKAVSLSDPLDDGFCATINVQWAVESPLLIGDTREKASDGKSERVGPLKVGDAYVIPGASLRGMIRAATEIIAFARLRPANFHHRYGLRDFDHPDYADQDGGRGYPLARVADVRAGWLRWEPQGSAEDVKLSDYVLEPCRWAHVEAAVLVHGKQLKVPPGTDRERWVSFDLERKYGYAGMRAGDGIRFEINKRFRQAPDLNGRAMFVPDEKGSIDGVLVFSGKAPGQNSRKRFEYVFFGDSGERVRLTREEFNNFDRVHSRPSRNKPEPDGTWRMLRDVCDGGDRIPVFYVGDPAERRSNRPGPFAMGLTRLFKVPHQHSVGDVVARQSNHGPRTQARGTREQPSADCDFVESLFGYVYEDDDFEWLGNDDRPASIARKGRISFSFGRFLEGQQLGETDETTTIMMGPRASFAPFYLRGEFKDYASGKARVSGRKRYLPRFARGDRANEEVAGLLKRHFDQAPQTVKQNYRIQTRLQFLNSKNSGELRFSSQIRLHNVRAEEIGAILWALTHGGHPDKPYRHMLGRAKPFGAGQIRVVSARLAVQANSGRSDLVKSPHAEECPGGGREGFCPPASADPSSNASHGPFIEAFEKHLEREIGSNWRTSDQIVEFLGLSRPENGRKLMREGRLEYLADVQDFARIRRMTQLRKDGTDSMHAANWRGRYLETPGDRD